ncbi:MAG: hypothetical protein ABH844_03875 [Candidatus Omnitrophota bacterium]
MTAALKKITPEEKLLQLIEGTHDIDKLSLKKNDKPVGRPFHFRPANPLPFLNKTFFSKKLTLRIIIKIMFGLCVILTVLLITYLVREEQVVQTRFSKLQTQKIELEPLELNLTEKETPDVSTFVGDTTQNNPFHLLPFAEDAENEEITPEAADLQLVGILWSNKAQAIIEDSSTKKTYVVSEGDSIEEYTVSKITQTEITISSKNGATTLK